MKKTFKSYFAAWVILFALFNIICFVTPNESAGLTKFGGAFWSGYVFITLAFIGQLYCAFIAFKAENLQKLFYNLPLIKISYTGLILTVIFGAICMAIPNLPNWIGIIVCLIILAFNAIAVIKAKAAAEVVSAVDDKTKAQTFFIKSLTVDSEGLIARAQTEEIKNECKKVYEAVRYSDPMSNAALAAQEAQITLKINELAAAVNANNADNTKKSANELIILIEDRNKKCRLLK